MPGMTTFDESSALHDALGRIRFPSLEPGPLSKGRLTMASACFTLFVVLTVAMITVPIYSVPRSWWPLWDMLRVAVFYMGLAASFLGVFHLKRASDLYGRVDERKRDATMVLAGIRSGAIACLTHREVAVLRSVCGEIAFNRAASAPGSVLRIEV